MSYKEICIEAANELRHICRASKEDRDHFLLIITVTRKSDGQETYLLGIGRKNLQDPQAKDTLVFAEFLPPTQAFADTFDIKSIDRVEEYEEPEPLPDNVIPFRRPVRGVYEADQPS